MEEEIFSRNILFWGEDIQKKLSSLHIAVFGLGGVGSFAAEALARAGIGEFTLIDFDRVSPSNINRQLYADLNTIGNLKTKIANQRILSINNKAKVHVIADFYTEDMNHIFEETHFDFVIDAIDSFNFKIALIEYCLKNDINIITSLGAANRIKPYDLYISDLGEVEKVSCPFAQRVIARLKNDGFNKNLPLVLSKEKPKTPINKEIVEENITLQSGKTIEYRKITPSTTPFVAPVAGFFMAAYAVEKCIANKK